MATPKKFTGYRHQHYRPIPEQRIERWLGAEKVEHLRQNMRGWYGSPINLIDVPGSVWIDAEGDFVGTFNRGLFYSALDGFGDWLKLLDKESQRLQPATLNTGFASISDTLARATQGFSQRRNFLKSGSTGVVNGASTLWRAVGQPASGLAPAAAPGGLAPIATTVGALDFASPAVGLLRLVGADVGASVVGNTLLLYDRIFHVTKTMNSTAAEAVTGVPTRYQSTNPTDANEDFIGDNFLTIEVGGTALAATAHNWTPCTYTDQDNVAGVALPSVAGVSGAIVDRLDMVGAWFAPLAAGDSGIKNLTNMQCNAAVATGVINFVIGHPIGFMTFPVANGLWPFDWLTNRDLAPKIFNNACPAFLEMPKPATGATTYTGRIYATSTSS
jgi:hypothetical protein